MPRKKRTTRKTSRRGGALKDWTKKAHNYIRSRNGYSKGLSYAYNRFGRPMVDKKFGQHSALVNSGVNIALGKLKQAGYGLRRTGHGLRRTGNGLRRTGNGLRRTGNGTRMKY
jgi:hypothetical protein